MSDEETLIIKATRRAIRDRGLPRTRIFPLERILDGSYAVSIENRHGVGSLTFVPPDADFTLGPKAFADRYIAPDLTPETGWEFLPPPAHLAGAPGDPKLAALSEAVAQVISKDLRERAQAGRVGRAGEEDVSRR